MQMTALQRDQCGRERLGLLLKENQVFLEESCHSRNDKCLLGIKPVAKGSGCLSKNSQLIDISLNPALKLQQQAFIKDHVDPNIWHLLTRASPEPPGCWTLRQPKQPTLYL